MVITTDTLVEGVHFLSTDPPEDVAWKLIAVNLSDLAAKGAIPEGVLLNYVLADDDGWDRRFVAGLSKIVNRFSCPIIGGDTVRLPVGTPRVLSVTAIGRSKLVPRRGGACAGDALYVTGSIGDGGAGLAIARGGNGHDRLTHAYRRPIPLLAEGQMLGPLVHAMSDVSDGLLIDAQRMAVASGLEVVIDLDRIPLSREYVDMLGEDRLAASTAGDDYQLLFAASADLVLPVKATLIGRFRLGSGIVIYDNDEPVPLPSTLGFEH